MKAIELLHHGHAKILRSQDNQQKSRNSFSRNPLPLSLNVLQQDQRRLLLHMPFGMAYEDRCCSAFFKQKLPCLTLVLARKPGRLPVTAYRRPQKRAHLLMEETELMRCNWCPVNLLQLYEKGILLLKGFWRYAALHICEEARKPGALIARSSAPVNMVMDKLLAMTVPFLGPLTGEV